MRLDHPTSTRSVEVGESVSAEAGGPQSPSEWVARLAPDESMTICWKRQRFRARFRIGVRRSPLTWLLGFVTDPTVVAFGADGRCYRDKWGHLAAHYCQVEAYECVACDSCLLYLDDGTDIEIERPCVPLEEVFGTGVT